MREYTIRQMNMKISQFDASEYRCFSEYFSLENSYYFVHCTGNSTRTSNSSRSSGIRKKKTSDRIKKISQRVRKIQVVYSRLNLPFDLHAIRETHGVTQLHQESKKDCLALHEAKRRVIRTNVCVQRSRRNRKP